MENINYSIENFRQALYDLINNSQLPIGTVYFVFKDVFTDLNNVYQNTIQQEAMLAAIPKDEVVTQNEENSEV